MSYETEERAGILEFEANLPKPEAERTAKEWEEQRHAAEVRSCIRQYYPDGKAAAAYFNQVEQKRGKEAADRLRADVRVAWKAKQEERGRA